MVTIAFNDTQISLPTDTHINIVFTGILSSTETLSALNINSATQTETDSTSLQNGAGQGTIGGASAIVTATANSSGTGIKDFYQ